MMIMSRKSGGGTGVEDGAICMVRPKKTTKNWPKNDESLRQAVEAVRIYPEVWVERRGLDSSSASIRQQSLLVPLVSVSLVTK